MIHIFKYACLLFTLLTISITSLTATSTPVPQLFFALEDLPQIRGRIASSEWLSKAFEFAITEADHYLTTEVDPYDLLADGVGPGTAGRAVQHRLATLAMVGYISGEQKYLDRGKDILMAVVSQTEPDTNKHWIRGLQTADAAQGIAYGYDFFAHRLSGSEKAVAIDYLKRIGSTLYESDTVWGAPTPGVTSCNHNSVRYGALGLVALALGNQPEWLDLSKKRVRGFYEHFIDATGYATEGHNYLGYGLSGAYPFSYALKRATGEELWDSQPAFKYVGNQILWGLLPFDGRMVPIGDASINAADPSAILPALQHGNGSALWAWLKSLPDYEKGLVKANGQLRAAHGSHLLYLVGDDKVLEPLHPKQANLPLGFHFKAGRVFLRSSWEGEDAAHVLFNSGYDFHRGHDHHDENSLTFAAFGEAFIIDPGHGLYSPKEAEYHTTVTVNGVGQINGGRGRIVAYREDKYGAFVRGQAEEAYDFESAWIGMADRKMYFVRGPQPYLVWRDDLQLETDRDATWVAHYISDHKNKLTQHGNSVRIDGYRGKASCMLHVFSEDKPIKILINDLSDKTFSIRGTTRPLDSHLSRATATHVAVNPRLLSIILPFYDEKDLPDITVAYDHQSRNISATLCFPSGYTDTLVIGLEDCSFERK